MMGFGDVLQQRNEHWKQFNREKILSSESGRPSKSVPEVLINNENPIPFSSGKEYDEDYKHDCIRTKNMIIVGVLQGPFHHYFYLTLDRILPAKNSVTIVKKTLIDQLVASPVCLAIFFYGLGILEHRKMKDINEEVKLKLMDTWKVDWCYWPPIQFINFLLIPIQYRVIYINLMTMIYDMFLSYMKYDAQYD
ncbi:mpv17-like protein 2 isoform X2 [Athalia rosae]|nr:mpv17-like protein 2 isoform X2 [Athalia rosae]XP_020707985.2 mpv17-like protein 2 isoform X2 [Athalia rosae]XP_020707986.2 mpv17-like protein 2 isoform X2 [Athalia rosae]